MKTLFVIARSPDSSGRRGNLISLDGRGVLRREGILSFMVKVK
jgi:hypothetical protein